MTQSTTSPSEGEQPDVTPKPTIEDTQPINACIQTQYMGAAAYLMGCLALSESITLDVTNSDSRECFIMGIRLTAGALAAMYPDSTPEIPFSW